MYSVFSGYCSTQNDSPPKHTHVFIFKKKYTDASINPFPRTKIARRFILSRKTAQGRENVATMEP